jgi:hypothetical protein
MLYLLSVIRSGAPARDDGYQPENRGPDLVWHDVNGVVNQDEKQPLAGIRFLVWVLDRSPKIAATKMNDDRFKGNLAGLF